MAYELHIERADAEPIDLSEWCAAVQRTDGVRLYSGQAHTITNPKTGEVISIGAREGDAEVLFPVSGQWSVVFRWQGESVAFAARFDPSEVSHPVWKAAKALASRLGCVIRGDDGEMYDLETGRVVE